MPIKEFRPALTTVDFERAVAFDRVVQDLQITLFQEHHQAQRQQLKGENA